MIGGTRSGHLDLLETSTYNRFANTKSLTVTSRQGQTFQQLLCLHWMNDLTHRVVLQGHVRLEIKRELS